MLHPSPLISDSTSFDSSDSSAIDILISDSTSCFIRLNIVVTPWRPLPSHRLILFTALLPSLLHDSLNEVSESNFEDSLHLAYSLSVSLVVVFHICIFNLRKRENQSEE
ncbi:unnamed protein product [Vicia faba]|uniref:Uncharacterized protein n=1 Tax=Vicia faba TaxID=3906 RepID=A0AAV1AAK0_VICFA|nr:unnamed protein product [Vicia faba]